MYNKFKTCLLSKEIVVIKQFEGEINENKEQI